MSVYDYTSRFSPKPLLEAAFATICPENWKDPIRAVISRSAFDITNEACSYFTGSKLEIDPVFVGPLHPNQMPVVADGYYAAVGA